jgi:outer membrane protein
MPLYKTGADYSRARAAEQKVTEQRMKLEEARHQAYEDATNGWHSLETSRASLAADEAEKDASNLALDNVREEAKSGTRTTLDVLNAEQELIDAQSGIIQAEHDIAVAILQIRSATGLLTAEALKLPVDLYDPTKHYETARSQWIGFSDDADEPAGK